MLLPHAAFRHDVNFNNLETWGFDNLAHGPRGREAKKRPTFVLSFPLRAGIV